MKKVRFIPSVTLIFSTCLFMYGCATTGSKEAQEAPAAVGVYQVISAKLHEMVERQRTKETQPSSQEIDKQWRDARARCAATIEKIDDKIKDTARAQFSIAMIGTVAGVVVAPALIASNAAANKTLSTIASGVAGAANTAQKSISEYYYDSPDWQSSRETLIQQINSISDEYWTAVAANNRPDQLKVINKLVSRCEFFALRKAANGAPTPK